MDLLDLHIPTHEPVDPSLVFRVLKRVLELGTAEPVTAEALEGAASAEEAPRGLAYAALGLHPGIRVERRAPVAVTVCVGRCQMWGAVQLIERLIEHRDANPDEPPPFDLMASACVAECLDAPSLRVEGPGGRRTLPRPTLEAVTEAVRELSGG